MGLWVFLLATATLVFLSVPVAELTGLDPARDAETALGGIMIALTTGVATILGVFRLRWLSARNRLEAGDRRPS